VTNAFDGTLRDAGDLLARESARFAALGWMRGTSGNLSLVLEREPLRLAVTASGKDKGDLSASNIVVVDDEGRAVDPDAGRPSAEAAFHARIAQCSGAGAVVHVHHLGAVVAADRFPSGITVEGLEMLKGIGRKADGDPVTIPVVANSQDMFELGDRFVRVFDSGTPAVVIARHGLYAWGADMLQARHHTEIVAWVFDYLLHNGGNS
jgi:methylthioribulose-1-phosphate dehydratase